MTGGFPPAVTRVFTRLQAPTKTQTRQNWLRAVAVRTTRQHPDLAAELVKILGIELRGNEANPLGNLSIEEIAVCYGALLATLDSRRRRSAGQFFTPDDAAAFMAAQSRDFPAGTWLDPCCGVGNLAWHLVAAQSNPARFVCENLVLIDVDETALRSAVALLGADFLSGGDHEGLAQLWAKASNRDFLSKSGLAPHENVTDSGQTRRREKLGF